MRRSIGSSFHLFIIFAAMLNHSSLAASNNLLKDGGFEQGFAAPWGVGQYSDNGLWWNSGDCDSAAGIDSQASHSGTNSLHIVNLTARAPNVYGTTVQEIAVQPDRKYRITLWARGKELASPGAVNIIADQDWKIRPIALPAGTFGWRKFEGTFQLPSSTADIRIISEDKGEAWIDDISVAPVEDETRALDDIASAPVNTVGINTITCSPRPALRGQQAKIAVDYTEPLSNAPVPVVEEWTLLFNGKPVIAPFRRQFEIRQGQTRHEFMLPIPTQADVGMYKMKLHTVSPAPSVDGQVLIEVLATQSKG